MDNRIGQSIPSTCVPKMDFKLEQPPTASFSQSSSAQKIEELKKEWIRLMNRDIDDPSILPSSKTIIDVPLGIESRSERDESRLPLPDNQSVSVSKTNDTQSTYSLTTSSSIPRMIPSTTTISSSNRHLTAPPKNLTISSHLQPSQSSDSSLPRSTTAPICSSSIPVRKSRLPTIHHRPS
jgi:hypothetical protein